jgi:Kef-type K+ transport system membrane component KefB
VRYFAGGVEFMPTVFVALCILGANATVNAIVIAASAFKNYLARVAMIGFLLASALFTVGISTWFAYAIVEKLSDPQDHPFLFHGLIVVFCLAAGLVTTLLPLQIARGKLRLFERDYELSNTSSAVILAVCIPIFLLLAGIATAGFGVPLILLGFAWCIKELDSPTMRPVPTSGTRVAA